MNLKNLLQFLLSCILLILTACAEDVYLFSYDDKLVDGERYTEFGMYGPSSSNIVDGYTLIYPMNSFIDDISLNSSDIEAMDNALHIMQSDLGFGYNPLFAILLQERKINKISRGLLVDGLSGAYNPYSNSIVLRIDRRITLNVVEEELIHAGQDRVYPNGILQYAQTGKPNIEFEAKLTQDLMNFVNDIPVAYLGAGPHNIEKYMGWIFKLCDDIDYNDFTFPRFPSLMSVLDTTYQNSGYFEFMADFKIKSPQYDYEINDTLKPLYINFTHKNYGKK